MATKYFLYSVSSLYNDQHGDKKLGATTHPVHRMRVYNTGDSPGVGLEKKYNGIWQVNAKSTVDLIRFEKHLHAHFDSLRKKRSNGNNTEWFTISLEAVSAFLNAQKYVMCQLSLEEIHIIQEKSERNPAEEDKLLIEEESFMEEQQKTAHEVVIESAVMTPKEEFFATFLPDGCLPRRNQDELWDTFYPICEKTYHCMTPYRGITQWATGTGKTIALLIQIVICAIIGKEKGILYRGLLVSPKNDIFHTILSHISKLSKWGITVCEGHNGKLSSLSIPLDRPILIIATHASLTDSINWNKLPSMTHCHYDEVHRITGDEFHTHLQQNLQKWNTLFLTGTSATPKTCVATQHKKLAELFGNPLSILHRCDVDEAIHEEWIAQPRFGVHVLSNRQERLSIIDSFVTIVRQSIEEKRSKGQWKGGKVIVYLPSRQEVCEAVSMAKEIMPLWHHYTAVEDADATADDKFISDVADGQPRILFACERYREGSDIKGLEMTSILMGNSIAAYILLQIAGRALRLDYKGKEGWCVIVRPSEEGTTEDEVFDAIVLEIMEFIGSDGPSPTKEKIKKVVEKFFGPVTISGKVYHIEETIQRIQAMYVRKAFERPDPKEKYEVIRNLNRELGLQSRAEYDESARRHHKYINDPKSYFKNHWISWYHFLGVDISSFPPTKAEWIARWKQMGIRSWTEYKQKNSALLPINPAEMYEDYTNPDKEFEEEDEIIW
jgi:superfamily II DNA/RNA helicase